MDKETRAWDAYNGAENAVKNMMTSLRAVGELQNPSIRDRHWTQLMQATGVRTARPTQPPILVSRGVVYVIPQLDLLLVKNAWATPPIAPAW